MMYPNLFSPVKLGNLTIKNKLFQSVGEKLLTENDRGYTQRWIDYYEERAKNGVGLFITGHVKMESVLDPCPIKMSSLDRDFKWFAELCETVHRHGAKIAIQLNPGAGRLADALPEGFIPKSASSGPLLYFPNRYTQELTIPEIKERVQIYGKAAATAKAAGFDMICINCQAYLNDQFLTPAWNHRTDEYGGSIENRMRFIMEQIDAVRATCGPNFPIMAATSLFQGIKDGKTEEDWIAIAKAFEEKGVVALHLRNGAYDAGEFAGSAMATSYITPGPASQHNVDKVKPFVNIPIISDGSFETPEQCEQMLAEGRLTMVGVDRPLIADPEWPKKAREGRPEDIRPCLRCMECMSRYVEGKFLGCAVNPLAGREAVAYKYYPVEKKKKILIIGGGHSGMLTAIYASKRGHDITMVEKDTVLGGHILQAAASTYKHDYMRYVEWMKRELAKTDVKVVTGVTVDEAYIEAFKPDEIVVCSGSVSAIPPIPGVNGKNVKTAMDVLLDHSEVGENVVLMGSGMVGCETAIDLAMAGKKVTLVELAPTLGNEILVSMRKTILWKMEQLGVDARANTRAIGISDEGVTVINAEGKEQLLPCDTVVLATGLRPDNSLYYNLVSKYPNVHIVGDCNSVGRFLHSGRAAYAVANCL